jgi:hypothetical protein
LNKEIANFARLSFHNQLIADFMKGNADSSMKGKEVFGATNTPHLGNPGTDVTNPATFGVIASTLNLAGRGTGSGGEQQLWFAGKLLF